MSRKKRTIRMIYLDNMEIVKDFESIISALRSTGINMGNISSCASKKLSFAGRYKGRKVFWEFKKIKENKEENK